MDGVDPEETFKLDTLLCAHVAPRIPSDRITHTTVDGLKVSIAKKMRFDDQLTEHGVTPYSEVCHLHQKECVVTSPILGSLDAPHMVKMPSPSCICSCQCIYR